jgi:hypothetical protein
MPVAQFLRTVRVALGYFKNWLLMSDPFTDSRLIAVQRIEQKAHFLI